MQMGIGEAKGKREGKRRGEEKGEGGEKEKLSLGCPLSTGLQRVLLSRDAQRPVEGLVGSFASYGENFIGRLSVTH